jgi:NitT/TauT family transport system permease protein
MLDWILSRRVLPWLVTTVFFLLWEGAVVAFDIQPFILPAPSLIGSTFIERWEPISSNSLQTLMTTLVGLGMAIVVGIALGLAISAHEKVYAGLYPLLVAFNSIPKVALVPLLVIWFGIGTIPAILTAFLISFFPIVVNIATGIATVEPELNDLMRSLRARRLTILRKVGLPRTLPYFFAALKVSVTLAFVGSVISETVAANAGIGYMMVVAGSRFDVPLVFAGLMAIGAMGILLYQAAEWLERKLTFWAMRNTPS